MAGKRQCCAYGLFVVKIFYFDFAKRELYAEYELIKKANIVQY